MRNVLEWLEADEASLPDKIAYAMSYHFSVFSNTVQRQGMNFQCVVDGFTKILYSVYEGAVKVE